ncbi:sensor histidine kinase [Runella aurantiaca]|uniref:histidine kinase n=1 Tax=Runella aurantiaca TaxID=2282308 RepID=A0A369IGE8_9BACT|nr:sensor histidine kinase [Runella aurantiaca]RDB07850.1 sensor histidine kinase [Runella aurantiaca]
MLLRIYRSFRWRVEVHFLSVIFLNLCCLPISAQKNTESTGATGQIHYEQLRKTQKRYEEAIRSGDSSEIAEMCYRLGKRYISLGQHVTAQRWLIRSLRMREPLGPSEDVGKVYIFLANYPTEHKKYDEAMHYIRKALANFRAVGNQQRIVGAYLSLAGLYRNSFELHQFNPEKQPRLLLDSALYFLQQAEKISLSLREHPDLGYVYSQFGFSLLYRDVKHGLSYSQKAQAIFIKEKNPSQLVVNSLNIAHAYLMLKQPGEAEKWLTTARYIQDTSGLKGRYQQRDFFKLYTQLYEQTGRWKEALVSYKQYQEVVIDALSADREGAVTRIEMEYETQKKELQLRAQQKELALRNQNLQTQQHLNRITIGIGLLAVITSIIFYWFFQKYRRLSRQNAALVSEQNHRVKNNLQQVTNLLSLQSSRLTDEEAKKAVTEALLRIEAMALVHHRLYDGHRLIEVNLALFIPELIESILRSYSFSHLKPEYILDSIWLHVDSAIPMGLLINELVTNSCKYAFPFSPEPIIKVKCQLKKNQIYLELTDNGPGFDLPPNPKTFGLKLLQVFSMQLKAESGFENGGTTFRLLFKK